ncbi:hypothetical protein NQZ68_009928 [Dissostichus eleginoides]|nr:hypothetical protein NQZ68_009928 [Dissostichus eleginoides]
MVVYFLSVQLVPVGRVNIWLSSRIQQNQAREKKVLSIIQRHSTRRAPSESIVLLNLSAGVESQLDYRLELFTSVIKIYGYDSLEVMDDISLSTRLVSCSISCGLLDS